MRKRTLPVEALLLTALVAGFLIPARLAHAQAKLTVDQKDQEIELLKSEIKQLEGRVETLEGLDQKVKVIDRKLEVQAETDHQKALEAPIIKAGAEGFSISSAKGDYKLNFGGLVQGDMPLRIILGVLLVKSTIWAVSTPADVCRSTTRAPCRTARARASVARVTEMPNTSSIMVHI